jgi:hypothetical protein
VSRFLEEEPVLAAGLKDLVENFPSPQTSPSLQELIVQWFKKPDEPQH